MAFTTIAMPALELLRKIDQMKDVAYGMILAQSSCTKYRYRIAFRQDVDRIAECLAKIVGLLLCAGYERDAKPQKLRASVLPGRVAITNNGIRTPPEGKCSAPCAVAGN